MRAQNEDGWETVAEESAEPVRFQNHGDEFIGRFVRTEHIEPPNDEPFDRYVFEDENGQLWAVNQSYKISGAIDGHNVQPGDWVRIVYAKDITTKRGQSPMKDFVVQVKRAGR